MPRKRHRIPSLRHHKPSGQAVVTLDGRDHYLGKWGSDASQASYDSLISCWMANGRRLPQDDPRPTLTIRSLAAAYLKHAEAYYRKPDGRPTNEVCNLAASLRPLVRMAANEDAATFGPRALARVRELMIQDGLARKTINGRIRRIRRVFRWAAREELLPAAVP